MNLSSINRTINLFGQLIDTKKSTVPIIKTSPQKMALSSVPTLAPFERTVPENVGVPSGLVDEFLTDIQNDKTINLHGIMIVKNHSVICEKALGMYDLNMPRMIFSASKSITSLAVGMLIDDGVLALNDKVTDIFSDMIGAINRIKLKELTVKDLLTMTSTVVFNELESISEEDWVKAFLNSSLKGEIGSTFNYNSLNTYMLAAIVCRKSGTTLTDFLRKRLFKPLGIEEILWEKCPLGIEKGGWGFYIRPEDLAKIGCMMLDGGIWNGKQIISSGYLKMATAAQSFPNSDIGSFNYGFQIWTSKRDESFLFNGMFGQNMICFKNNGIVIVTNAGNGELFQQSNYFEYLHKYFSGPFEARIAPNLKAYGKLQKTIASFEALPLIQPRPAFGYSRAFQRSLGSLNGKRYMAVSKDAPSVGLAPITMQCIQNLYTEGVKSVGFEVADRKLYINYEEAGEAYRFAVGFNCAEYTDFSFRGESFKAGACARFVKNEDSLPVLDIRIDFLEMPYSRCLKFVFDGDKLKLYHDEYPGAIFAKDIFENFKDDISEKMIFSTLIDKVDLDYVDYKIDKIFAPVIEFRLENKV